jgi:hypothetical protein
MPHTHTHTHTNLLHTRTPAPPRTQFVGGYEQNMMTTARLGSAYHGVVANFTKEGPYPVLVQNVRCKRSKT